MLLPPAGDQLAELVVVQAVLDLDDAARLSRVQEEVPVVLGRQSVRVELDADRLKRSEPTRGVERVGAADVDDLLDKQGHPFAVRADMTVAGGGLGGAGAGKRGGEGKR